MELYRIDTGTGKSPSPTQGRAAAAIAEGGFEAIISDRGVELSSTARAETAVSGPSPASSIDPGVQASPVAEGGISPTTLETQSGFQSPTGSVPANSTYNQHGGSAKTVSAASPLGQKLDITG